ncbi:hypothetical protein SUGI_1059750 [Cryptomeria japonica]|uniref:uncharacterized protein LOC131027722 n=1 Tax=Cryptomeria japonica TaxID=3369 RepID=UPI002414BB07|nr:uncharacterized protein LOC131027722 [Cryptomeria japonica]GLJ49867.1 hypothetical protein SUGI_1059750 [Cryptomeria japonica]
MAWSAIDDQITREFSFIQETVWGAPYRNPFPSCTNKIISDLKALNASLFSNRYKSFRHENASKASILDGTARILDCDALKLIEFRRLYCNRLLKLQRVLGEEKLLDLENKVDRILVQHIQSAWENGLEGSERVDWMIEATQIDFTVLDKSVCQIFDCFQRENKIKPEDLSHFNRDTLKNADKVSRVEEPRLTEQSSCSPQTFSDNEEESSCDSYNESPTKSSLIPSENNAGEEIIELEDDKLCIHSPNTKKTVRLAHLPKGGARIAYSPRSWPRFPPNSQRKNHSAPHLEVEMVMKSRLRRNPEQGGAYLWHIIFGLVNHGACKLEVNSLSFWSIDPSSGSDVCSINWPKGDVILLEGPSFLCYSTKMPCTHHNYDSPRVTYSWKYRRLEDRSSSSKRHEGMHATSMCESPTEKGSEKFQAGEDKKDSNLKTPIYKRLGSIMLDWSANSLKRMRRSSLDS